MTRGVVADQSAVVLRNLADSNAAWSPSSAGGWNTQWFGGNGGAGTSTFVSNAGPGGCGVIRKTWTAAGNGQDVGVNYTFPQVLKPNTFYTFSASVVASFLTGHAMAVVWYDSTGTAIAPGSVRITGSQAQVATTPGQRVRLVGSITSPSGAVYARLIWGPYPSIFGATYANPSVGDSIDGYEPMAVEGAYSGEFVSAALPGSRWVRLPDGTSAGYPYTLSRTLGGTNALIALEGNGNSSSLGLARTADRTIYWVYDVQGTPSSSSSQPAGRYGGTQLNQSRARLLQGNGSDFASGQIQVTWGLGSTESAQPVLVLPGAFAPGRHIVTMCVSINARTLNVSVDGSPWVYQDVHPATPGWEQDAMFNYSIGTANITETGVAMYAIPTNSLGQARSAETWLANRYGVVLAS